MSAKRRPAGPFDPAEGLAAEIVAAFDETGLRPESGDWITQVYDSRGKCHVTGGCAVGVLRYLAGFDDLEGVVDEDHVDCVTVGWDTTLDGDDRPITVHGCPGEIACLYYQAGVLAAHAMETR